MLFEKIIMPENGKKTKPNRFRFNELRRYVLDENLCIHCGACAAVCPVNVIGFADHLPFLKLRQDEPRGGKKPGFAYRRVSQT